MEGSLETNSSPRIEYIDIARGLCILLVVAGHNLENEMLSFKLIYSFHVPAFFFISGMLFRPEKYKSVMDVIKDKTAHLLHPYFLFGFITMMVYCVFKESTISALKCLFFANRYQMMEVPFNVPMWFIPCAFIVYTLYYCVNKYTPPPEYPDFPSSFGRFFIGISHTHASGLTVDT